jgi:DNA-binding transcriptional regulator YiaG
MKPYFNQVNLEKFCYMSFPQMNGKQIAKLRQRMKWTQAEMAFALGVSSRLTVSQWEIEVRTPGGPTMRFLRLLDSCSDSELQKIAKRLIQIAQSEVSEATR